MFLADTVICFRLLCLPQNNDMAQRPCGVAAYLTQQRDEAKSSSMEKSLET